VACSNAWARAISLGSLQRGLQHWPGDIAQPDEPIARFGSLDYEPRRLAGALIDPGEAAIPSLGILDHEDRSRRSERGGHRHHGGMMIRRFQLDVPLRHEAFCLLQS